MKRFLFVLICLFILPACETTTNPKEGGLFSYSPQAYEARKTQRQERLKELQRQQVAEEQRKGDLETTSKAKKAERDSWQKKVNAANKDVASLKKELDGFQAKNEKQAQTLATLKERQARLSGELNSVKNMSQEEKRIEAERLRKEVERLTNDVAALSAL